MNFASFFSYAVITTFTPGPNNIMSMTNAGKYGFKQTLRFCLGVAVGFFALLLCAAGFSALLYAFIPKIKTIMSIIGAAYILYLAYTIVRDKPKDPSKKHVEPNGFLPAVLFQFINPKGLIYSITIMSSYIMPHYQAPAILLLFAAGLAITSLASTVLWALLGTGIDRVFSKHKKIINILMALLLVYCAVSLLLPSGEA